MSTTTAPRPVLRRPTLWDPPAFTHGANELAPSWYHLHVTGSGLLHAALVLHEPLSTEPRGHEGVSVLVARLLSEGTGDLDAGALAAALDSLAASTWSDISPDGLILGLTVPAGGADSAAPDPAATSSRPPEGSGVLQAVRLWARSVLEPAFSPADVDRARRELLADLASDLSDPGTRAEIELNRLLYPAEDRSSRPYAGTAESVSSLTREDVLERHQTLVASARRTLVTAGPISAAELATIVARSLKGVSGLSRLSQPGHDVVSAPAVPTARFSVPSPASDPNEAIPAGSVHVVDRPGATQTAVQAGVVTGPLTQADRAVMRVASHLLTDGMRSRLNIVLREEKGYTYGVRSLTDRTAVAPAFRLFGTFATPVIQDALRQARDLLIRFRETGPSAEELEAAVRALQCAEPITNQTGGAQVRAAASGVGAGLPPTWLAEQLALAEELTAESFLERYRALVPAALATALVGDGESLAPLAPRTAGSSSTSRSAQQAQGPQESSEAAVPEAPRS